VEISKSFLLKRKHDNNPTIMTKKKLKEVNVTEKKDISYDADMTVYEKYLHTLLIQTSDRY